MLRLVSVCQQGGRKRQRLHEQLTAQTQLQQHVRLQQARQQRQEARAEAQAVAAGRVRRVGVSVQVQHARAPRGRNDRSTAQRRPIQQCAERSKYSCAFQLHTVRLYQLGTTIPSSRLYRVYTPPEPPRPALPEYENFWTRYFFELNCPKYG